VLSAASVSAQESRLVPDAPPQMSVAERQPDVQPAPPPPDGIDSPSQPVTRNGARIFTPEPRRILGIMPNYRAVSAGDTPPPPGAKEAFRMATKTSFDYSAFILVGLTSGFADARDAHPQLGVGAAGYARYYWRGFLDKTDGNYLVLFALPTLFHQDERYYAKGEGRLWKRAAYAVSRVAITPDYHGRNVLNISEILGRGMAQGISTAYYPSQARTIGALGSKYGFSLVGDAFTNVLLEFWPDIAAHVRSLLPRRNAFLDAEPAP
jgi:hypothetical protein